MIKKLLPLLPFFFFLFSISFSQEIHKGPVYDYARKIVDTMASESMHGRGYVNGGDSIAANYLKTEFKKFGLKNFGDDYYQRFGFAVNTFPDSLYFELHDFDKGTNNDNCKFFKGIPGANFLVSPDCPSAPIKLINAITFDSTYTGSSKEFQKFKKKIRNKEKHSTNPTFIIVDDRGVSDKAKFSYFKKVKENYFEVPGIIELVKKLTWDQAQEISKCVRIQIPIDSFNLSQKNATGVIQIQNKFLPNHPSQNVIGYIKGSVYPDSFIVFSAHYDHLGQMGANTYFPGANDNASGCAMLLNLAKYYSQPEHQPKYSIAFMAFCGEEVGLLGSKYYTEHPLFPLKNIKFLLNMDIMGTGEEGVTIVNGSIFKTEFDKLKQINTENNFIKDVKIRGKAANSDHYFFAENGVHACFMYTMGGIKAYHDIYDRAETLPLNEFENLFKLITKFSDSLQN